MTLQAHRRFVRTANALILAVGAGLLAGNLLLPMAVGLEDLLRYYTVAALLVELLLMYLPGQRLSAAMAEAGAPGMARRASVGEWVWGALLGVGALFLTTGINSLAVTLWESLGFPGMAGALPTEGGWRLPATILVVAVIPAFAEETLFRGALLSAWLPLGERRALWRVSLLFALIHFQPLSLPALLVISLLLGRAALETRSVQPSMAAHMANNVLAVCFSYAAAQTPGAQAAAAQVTLAELLPAAALYLALGGLGCFASLRGLKRAAAAARQAEAEGPAPESAPPQPEAIPQYRPGAPAQREGSGRAALALAYLLLGAVNVLVLLSLIFQEALLAAMGAV